MSAQDRLDLKNARLARLRNQGAGERIVLELRSSGSKVDDLLLELLRGAIRTRGGDVQVVLGR